MKIDAIVKRINEEFQFENETKGTNHKLLENEELEELLDNIGVDSSEDIDDGVIKKLSKKYGFDIKKPFKREEKIAPVKEMVTTIKKEIKEEPEPVKKETVKPVSKPEPKKQEVKKPEKEKPKKETIKPVISEEEELISEIEKRGFYEEKYSDLQKESRVHSRIKNVKKKRSFRGDSRLTNVGGLETDNKVLIYKEGMSVAQIADGLKINIGEVVKKLISLGHMVSASNTIDRDTVEVLALEYNYELKNQEEVDIVKFENIEIVDDPKDLVERPPIVTIMGHVDHGKTTLLDTIRNTKVVEGEAGHITQHIGAYQVKKNDKYITFIDTPGHEAFTEMRSRGAQFTDIVVLVVAADDGVMPQTKEAIEHAKAANVPIIVAVNKIDKPSANPERVIQELSAFGLVSEKWGGDTIFVPISALKGTGVDELLDNILVLSEVLELKANPNRLGLGTVVEAKIDKGRGVVATILVKNGTVKIGDPIVAGSCFGRIRSMSDEKQKILKQAKPSKAIEITGLSEVPNAGDQFIIFDDEKTARLIAEKRAQEAFNKEKGVGTTVSFASLVASMDDDDKILKLVVKGDVNGSIEALKSSLDKLDVTGVRIDIIRSAVGTITETDVTLAKASNAVIIGFNVRPTSTIKDLAREQKVEIRLYSVIYALLEDIEKAMKGMLDPVFEEKTIGEAEVRKIFKASKIGTIAGSKVLNGVIKRSAKARVIRDGITVYDGEISGLKHIAEDIKEAKEGLECGITIANFNDIKEGDIIEAYEMVKVEN